MNKETIRDFSGRILGYIETDSNGDQKARDFYGRILGTYDKKLDVTRDFYGRIINRGNALTGLVFSPEYNKSILK